MKLSGTRYPSRVDPFQGIINQNPLPDSVQRNHEDRDLLQEPGLHLPQAVTTARTGIPAVRVLKGCVMNDDIQEILKNKLQEAINQSLNDSPRINKVLNEIREQGYDVLLYIEATTSIIPKQEDSPVADLVVSGETEICFSPEDRKFLKTLKIKPE